MKTVFYTWVYGRFIEIQSNFKREKLQPIKAPIFLEVVLAIEIMQKPQSNLEEKVNTSILKDYFSSRTDPSIFTSIEPVLLDRSNETSEINKLLLPPFHRVL